MMNILRRASIAVRRITRQMRYEFKVLAGPDEFEF
ncbi:Uncharacterised protein [Arthrobacter agilis]|nr:Uncharacterised protein [Arthrobacter agilis]